MLRTRELYKISIYKVSRQFLTHSSVQVKFASVASSGCRKKFLLLYRVNIFSEERKPRSEIVPISDKVKNIVKSIVWPKYHRYSLW